MPEGEQRWHPRIQKIVDQNRRNRAEQAFEQNMIVYRAAAIIVSISSLALALIVSGSVVIMRTMNEGQPVKVSPDPNLTEPQPERKEIPPMRTKTGEQELIRQ